MVLPSRQSQPKPRATTADDASRLGPMLRPLLLLLLADEPGHGYGLAERLGELGVKPKGPSSLYRELRDLEAEGLISSAWNASQTRGPARRTYRLLRAGRRELDAVMPEVASVAHALTEAIARYRALSAQKATYPGAAKGSFGESKVVPSSGSTRRTG